MSNVCFFATGLWIIFQGDDMTRINTPLMEELTRLVQVDNGTSYYGTSIDGTYGANGWISVLNVGITELNTPMATMTRPLATGSVSARLDNGSRQQHPEKPAIYSKLCLSNASARAAVESISDPAKLILQY